MLIATVVLALVLSFVLLSFKIFRKTYRFLQNMFSMEEQRNDSPPPEEQKEILWSRLGKAVLAGEKWYLISTRWMKTMKRYIGIIESDQLSSNPGPIDNSLILAPNGVDLKKGLAEHTDYELVPEDCWKLLVKWYGYCPDQATIERKAILTRFNYAMVEVYLIELICYNSFELKNETILTVSRADCLSEIHNVLREKFSVKKSQRSRLWLCRGPDNYDRIDLSLSVQMSGFGNNRSIILETQTNSGEWIWNSDEENISDVQVQPSTSRQTMSTQTSLMSQRTTRATVYPEGTFKPGICGIFNLGNTCYMNSVLQCLSNTYPLTTYFLEGHHMLELNVNNPLGMGGEIARAYGDLIAKLWSGSYSSVNPLNFKVKVGKFNPEFCGCAQHDSQELLTFLLDGLHEDLNRITNKPYIQNEDYQGEEDHVFAMEYWKNYKMRNDSIIVDHFHGLLKSSIICSHCEYLSLAFDPFSTLSLPLPINQENQYKVKFVPYDPKKKELFLRISLSRRSLIKDLGHEVATKTSCKSSQLLVTDLNKSHFHRFYSNNEPLELYEDIELFHVYELPFESGSCSEYTVIPVCFWEKCKPSDEFSISHLFGMPLLIVLSVDNLKKESLMKTVCHHMTRHFFASCDSSDSDPNNSSSDSECPSSLFVPTLYLLDIESSVNSIPVKLEFDDEDNCIYNLSGLVELGDPSKLLSRKVLLVQMSVEEKQVYYTESAPDYSNDFHSGYLRCRGRLNISDCFDLFTSYEKLESENIWYCPTCKMHRSVTKKLDLWKLPNILILQLKRFTYTKGGDKIDYFVDFPIKRLKLAKYVTNPSEHDVKYNLIGVINHYGTMSGGHYTAYCKKQNSRKWFCYDDDSVTRIRTDDILSNAAYLLFYMRSTATPSGD